jgi:hypothetical protein
MKKLTLLLAFLLFAGMQVILAQTRDVTGTVSSADDGATIPGASVVVKGTTVGTITDMEGHFALKAPASAKTLVVSFVGFTSQEIALSGAKEYKIALKSEQVSVDEVVVVGYGTQKKREVTGAISQVKGEQMANLATPSFESQLAGRSAGV